MPNNVDDFLAGYGLGGNTLTHKERTVKDVMDEMTPEQKDFQALIVGAAVDNASLADAPEVIEQYNALTTEHKNVIDFLVGNIVAEETIKHSVMDVENFLSHYGVKGMKWGVVRDRLNPAGSLNRSSSNTAENRAAARAKVATGTASKKEEHLASLKSTGHRAINALTGDKTFWRRMAITTGLTVTAVAAPVAAAWLLPTAVLGAIGSIGTAGVAGSLIFTPAELGIINLGTAAIYGGSAIAVGGTAVNVVGNTARAVAGNSLISRSYERIGKTMATRQSKGRQRVEKALKTVAGIRDKDLKHSIDLDDFLEHFNNTTFHETKLVET